MSAGGKKRSVTCPTCGRMHAAPGGGRGKIACDCGQRLRLRAKADYDGDARNDRPAGILAADAGLEDVRRAWAGAVGRATDAGVSLKSADSEPLADEAARSILSSLRAATGAPSASFGADDDATPPVRTVAPTDSLERNGDFVMGELIGRGGMGLVFRAEQSVLGRPVALKTILAEKAGDPGARMKFLYEAQVTGRLEHPNIVPVYELASAPDGSLFYTMKEVKGEPWSRRLAEMGEAENIDVLLKVADAIAFAHGKEVVHRDIKPDNVMLGGYGEVLLMDWGLAAGLSGRSRAERLTGRNARGGTPAYMAPEMAAGDLHWIGPASDVYLLGAVLYEILTGKRPHHGESVFGCIFAALRNRIEDSPRRDEWVGVARKAMATDPGRRYSTVKDFQAAVRECRDHAASMTLAAEAKESLNRARERGGGDDGGDYGDYAKAVFGFDEALRLWPENAAAAAGATVARKTYAEAAMERGDYALAISQAAALDPANAGDILRRALEARDEQLRHRRNATLLGRAAMAAMGAMAIYGIYASGRVHRAARVTEEARAEARRNREIDARERLESIQVTEARIQAAQNRVEEIQGEKQDLEARIVQARREREEADRAAAARLADADDRYERLLAAKRILEARVAGSHAQPESPPVDGAARAAHPALRTPAELHAALRAANPGYNDDARFVEANGMVVEADFSGGCAAIADLTPLRGLALKRLLLPWSRVTRLDALRGMPLEELRIGAAAEISVAPLRGMSLDGLHLRFHAIHGLETALKGMPLTDLSLHGHQTDSLAFLKGLPLKRLSLSAHRPTGPDSFYPVPLKAPSLTPLRGMALEFLEIDQSLIRTLEPLRGMPLRELRLPSAKVNSLTPLKGMSLNGIEIHGVFTSLEPLRGMGLEWLRVAAPIRSLTPLRGMALRALYLRGSKVDSLEPLAGMRTLAELSVAGEITSLKPLAGTRLTHLAVDGPALDSLTGIEGLPLENLEITGGLPDGQAALDIIRLLPLTRLVIPDAGITNLSPLRSLALAHLDISDNPVRRLEPLAGMPLRSLVFTPTVEIGDIEALRGKAGLQSISTTRGRPSSAAAFWRRYDAGELIYDPWTPLDPRQPVEKQASDL